MAVKRALEVDNKNKIDLQMEEGKNPVDEFQEEFRRNIENNTKKLEKLEDKANKILDDAMNSDSVSDRTKAVREARDTLKEIKQNYIAQQQYYNRQVSGLDREAFQKQQEVKILLVKWINVIKEEIDDPVCKEKVISKVIKLIDLENEEVEERENGRLYKNRSSY
jgi:predicted S18 family serine protease